jgi:AraC-like DNA-binding protein
MKQSRSAQEPPFAALQQVMLQIESWLARDGATRVIVGAPTLEEFERQKLPPHCKAARCKLRGPRVPTRGNRLKEHPIVVARWPQDALVESTSPALLFVLDGEADVQFADYVVRGRAGDSFFLPARIPKRDGSGPHYDKITPESRCDLLFLSLTSVGLHSVEAHICHSRGKKHEMSSAGENCWLTSRAICLLLDALSETTKNEVNSQSAFHLIAAVVSLLRQEIVQGRCFDPRVFPSTSSAVDNYTPISKAAEYIQNHLYGRISIDVVARWVGLSRTVFIRRFREETGETFKEHLTRLRLEQAGVLLLQTSLTVEQISQRVGLSPGQLRNLFHTKHGCSPAKFRRSQNKSETGDF